MDIEEFERKVQPSAKRSRLEPFRTQIFELKAKGYADWQVRDWLAANGLQISRQAVQQFIKKGEKGMRVHASGQHSKPQQPAAAPQVFTPKDGVDSPPPAESEDLSMLTPKQRRERLADQFIKTESQSTNPLLKSILKKDQSK